MWKDKSKACRHCMSRPNRWQAATAMAMWRPQTAEEPPAAHAKERCPGCGLWKDKQRECLHCASRPNRMQVTSAIMTSIDDEFKKFVPQAAPEHQKVRCPGCGMWKYKFLRTCVHCANRPNRRQVARSLIAAAKGGAVEVAGVDGAPPSLERPTTASAAATTPGRSPHHAKERCPGCGLWKSKAAPCAHCMTRPNRWQVQPSLYRDYKSLMAESGGGGGGEGAQVPPLPALLPAASPALFGAVGSGRPKTARW